MIKIILVATSPFYSSICSSNLILYGLKRDEITGEWRKLHNEELNDLYCSPNIVRVIKSKRMRWTGHVARMGIGEERRIHVFDGETWGKEATWETQA
jgi:hypothetical protein